MALCSRWLSMQTTVSSSYRDEMVTEEDDSKDLATMRPLELRRREKRFPNVKVWRTHSRLLEGW